MKIAAIITGQTRHFWYTLPSVYERVIKPNNIDCYVMYNNNSSYDYLSPETPKHRMNEDFIISDILGESLKNTATDSSNEFISDKQYYISLLSSRMKSIEKNKYDNRRIWFYNDLNKVKYLVDEWLKIKYTASILPEGYDRILRIRMDIPFYNEFILSKKENIQIYYEEGEKSDWAKEYLFYGNTKDMLYICNNFVDYLFMNLDRWPRGDEELCLVNEVQFGKFLKDHNIKYSQINKPHIAGKFYNFYNLQDAKYYHYSNCQDKITCYLDAGKAVPELLQDDIYDLYKN